MPLFAVGERGLLDRVRLRRARRRAPCGTRHTPDRLFSFAFVAITALMLAHPTITPGLGTFYERTIEKQLERESPFSVWGQEAGLGWLQTVVMLGALGLAVLVAFVPRRRSLQQLAALSAAVLIASQLGIDHWFYLYLPWFFGLAMVASLPHPERASPGS